MPHTATQLLPDAAGPVLHCPVCACPYLHQGTVEVIDNPSGNVVEGLHITIGGMPTQVTMDRNNEPGAFYDEVRIHFSCEWCCADLVLSIFQRKGTTHMGWEDRHGDTACGPDCERYPVPAHGVTIPLKEGGYPV